MKNSDTKEDFKSPYMKKVKERLSILKMNAQDKDAYYTYMKEVLTQRDVISAAEAKGEAKNKIEVARLMLLENLDINLISRVTGLTIKEISELKNKLG